MNAIDVLRDLFGRVETNVHGAVEGLDEAALTHRVGGDANSIAWLVWHLTRVQDDHVADVAGTEQVWTAQGWVTRFGLPFAPEATGYGQGGDEVAAVRAGADLLCWATTTPSTSGRCSTWAGSARPTWTGSSTGGGIRRSRSACASSASRTTTSSTPGRRRSCAGSSRERLSNGQRSPLCPFAQPLRATGN